MKDDYIQHHGFVTAIDDPEGLGRVKVHIPAIDGTNTNQKTIWVNILKTPEGFGNDAPSPPQVGTSVMIQVNKTNPSLRQVSHIVSSRKGKPNPNMPGNISLANKYRKPFEGIRNKNISGPPQMEQNPETLDRGSGKTKPIVSQKTQTYEPTITDRDGLQTIIPSLVSMIQNPPPLLNVATARQEDSSIFTSAMGNSLPGIIFRLSDIYSLIPKEAMDEIQRTVSPDVLAGLNSVVSTTAAFYAYQSDGYLQQEVRVNPDVFVENMINELLLVTNVRQLQDFIWRIQYDDSITGLSLLDPVTITSNNSFGETSISLSADGTVEETTSELLAIIQSLFSSLFYGIPTMGGSSSFMSGSQIPNTLLNRMPAQAGNQHREFLGRVGGQNNPPRQLIEGTLTTLKNRLGS